MSRFELPEDWITGLLEQAVTVKSGVGFPHKFQGKLTGDFPVYKVGDLSKAVLENDGYLCRAGNYVNADEIPQLKGEVFPKGSTLFAKIGEAVKLNRRAYVEVEGLADNNVMSVVPVIEQSKRFIYYFLKTVDLTDVSRSTTVPSIRKGDIERLSINWPSLAEQKVIADKLDNLLSQVESIKARLEHIPEILKRFRQSLLAAVVSGKLTEEQTTDLGWRKIETFALDIRYGTSKKCDPDLGATPVLRIPNIGSGYIDLSDLKYADFDQKELQSLKLEQGDLLIIRSNGSVDLVGKIAIVTKNEEHCLFAGYLIRLRLDGDVVDPKYVAYCLQSPQLRQVIELIARSTSGVNNINSKELLGLKIPVPALKEQRQIVQQIERLHSLSNVIEDQVLSALDRVNNLTQSILAKAFCGELTAEWREANPDLISGENSAEALLERVKAERELAKPMTKHGRGKA